MFAGNQSYESNFETPSKAHKAARRTRKSQYAHTTKRPKLQEPASAEKSDVADNAVLSQQGESNKTMDDNDET